MNESRWYPGNMAKAVSQLQADLKVVDVVIELIDARIPESSRNPSFNKYFKDKKRLLLLHKADRAEFQKTDLWIRFFRLKGLEAMAFSVKQKRYLHSMLEFLKQQERRLKEKKLKRPMRLIFTGIPNVGKSTLINHFVRRAVAQTGDRPGITRGRQWIRIMPGMDLLDTPGILEPRINEKTVKPLGAVGAIPAGRYDQEETATWLITQYLLQDRISDLVVRYRELEGSDAGVLLETVGRSLGCLQAGGKVDRARAAAIFLKDFQAGKLGRFTLEEPPAQVPDNANS